MKSVQGKCPHGHSWLAWTTSHLIMTQSIHVITRPTLPSNGTYSHWLVVDDQHLGATSWPHDVATHRHLFTIPGWGTTWCRVAARLPSSRSSTLWKGTFGEVEMWSGELVKCVEDHQRNECENVENRTRLKGLYVAFFYSCHQRAP